jgi:AraC-like DNA-binding protein
MLKPSFEALNHANNGNSFLVRTFEVKAFTAPYHFHPEYELTLILKGSGKRYVGSHMAGYAAGDLVLLGPNLPHCWKTEHMIPGKINAGSVVIQFSHEFLGDDFFNRTELQHIHRLLEKSSSGIQFLKRTAGGARRKIMELAGTTHAFKKLLLFLEILQDLAESKEYALLDPRRVSAEQSPTEMERLNEVMAYIVDNFRNEVSLGQAAAAAGMTPNAFCKYYKKMTRQTFMETVIEYRINYATQQLIQSNRPVSDICYDSGFGDISHFYKLFKKSRKMSPLHYRKKFMKEIV